MRTLLLLVGIHLLISTKQIQSQELKRNLAIGYIIDSETKLPIPSVTITITSENDSIYVKTSTTDSGFFFFKIDSQLTKVKILVSCMGYTSVKRIIELPTGLKLFNIDTIKLRSTSTSLPEVTVSGSHTQIEISKDSITFQTSGFSSLFDNSLEQLLKTMPGVKIDTDGGITIFGQKVINITIDGKELFGRNTKLPLKVFSSKMVKKIQFFNYKDNSVQYDRSAIGDDAKTMNIVLKPEYSRGLFNKTLSSVGTSKRYALSENLNIFGKNYNFTLLMGGNNTFPTPLFLSESDYIKLENSTMPKRSDQRSLTLAFTLLLKKISIITEYSNTKSVTDHSSSRILENKINDSGLSSSSGELKNLETTNHSANLKVIYKPDSSTTLLLSQAIMISKTKDLSSIAGEYSFDGIIQSKSFTNFTQFSTNNSSTSELSISRALKKLGRSVTLQMTTNYVRQKGIVFTTNNSIYYDSLSQTVEEKINQERAAFTMRSSTSISLLWIEPLFPKVSLFVQEQLDQSTNNQKWNTFYYTQSTSSNDTIESKTNTNLLVRTNLSYTSLWLYLANHRINMSVGTTILNMSRTLILGDERYKTLKPSFLFVPSLKLSYIFPNKLSFHISYLKTQRQPTIAELFPGTDDSRGTIITSGNPSLKPELLQNFGISIQKGTNKLFWQSRIKVESIEDKIQYDYIYDSVQRLNLRNVNGNHSVQYNFLLSRFLKFSGFSLNTHFSTNIIYSHFINLLNSKNTSTQILTLNPQIGITFKFKDILEFKPALGFEFNKIQAENKAVLPCFKNSYFECYLTAKIANYAILALSFNRQQNGMLNSNIQHPTSKLNCLFQYNFIKKFPLQMGIGANNLLNQTDNFFRTIEGSKVEVIQTMGVKRYGFLYLSYEFRKAPTNIR